MDWPRLHNCRFAAQPCLRIGAELAAIALGREGNLPGWALLAPYQCRSLVVGEALLEYGAVCRPGRIKLSASDSA